jgi:hypothetical protein
VGFTSQQLTDLEDAYAAGILEVKHGDKTVKYANLDALWAAILRLRRALQPSTNRDQAGRVRFGRC